MDVLFPTLENAMEFVETGKINKYKKNFTGKTYVMVATCKLHITYV